MSAQGISGKDCLRLKTVCYIENNAKKEGAHRQFIHKSQNRKQEHCLSVGEFLSGTSKNNFDVLRKSQKHFFFFFFFLYIFFLTEEKVKGNITNNFSFFE